MSTATGTPSLSVSAIEAYTALVVKQWRAGAEPDLLAAVAGEPGLIQSRSVFVDLAYEFYCQLEERGQTPPIDAFCRDLPAFREHMRDVLIDHQNFLDHPEWLDPDLLPWPEAESDFAQFVILREIGRGSFARVYLAADPALGNRRIVLKLSVRSSLEANALGTIDHPNIGGVLWARPIDQFHVIAMPYIGEATYADLIASLDGGKKSRRIITRLSAGIIDALSYLHGLGIVHGDVKPSNVVLDEAGRPALIDFNLSSGRDRTLAHCGGTLPYMAPERLALIAGTSDDPGSGSAADVFAFCAMTFEAMTGSLPYHSDPKAELSRESSRLHGEWQRATPRVRDRNPRVNRKLARLLESGLAFEPSRRPAASELQRVIVRHQTRPRRLRRKLVAVCVALLTCVAATGGMDRLAHHQQVESKWGDSEPRTADDYFNRGLRRLQNSPKLAAVAANDFHAAYELRPDGKTAAHLAYCYTLTVQLKLAEQYYEIALNCEYKEAWVHNNRAFCLRVAYSSKDKLALAIHEALLAREKLPSCPAAKFNWVSAKFLHDLDGTTKKLNDLTLAHFMVPIVEQGPTDSDVWRKAAEIFSASGHLDPALHDRAIECLSRAVAFGHKLNQLKQTPVIERNLRDRRDFQELKPDSTIDSVQGQRLLCFVPPPEILPS